MSEGGYIGEPGDDSIPFVIHPGESWVTREMADKVGLEMLRRLTGGEVHVVDDENDDTPSP